MKAQSFVNVCSVVIALMVMMVAPALAQEEALTQREQEGLKRAERREKRAELQDVTPQTVPFTVRQVAVECFGNCNDSTLATICGPGWRPIAVDCQDVQDWGGGVSCGGNNVCKRFLMRSNDLLSDFCDAGTGWDANVYCAQ
jgi:hypothetical protein